jgi:hypothetical protein
MSSEFLELPMFGDMDCTMADDSLFADLISPDFLSVLEQAELTGQQTAEGTPTSSCSENEAVIRCPSTEVTSQTIPTIEGQQPTQQTHVHTVTTAPPTANVPSPSSSPDIRSSGTNLGIQWLSAIASTAPSAANHSSPEPCNQSGHTSDSSMDVQERPNKRKAPEIDWRSIEDPEERRRQRRLAKNRITAARSRERKKVQLAGMEGRMQQLEVENAQLKSLLEHCMKENSSLREQLASLNKGAGIASIGSATEPAALLYIAIMLVLLHFLDARGLSQALGLLMFTYVFFTATATGKLSLKQLSSPFTKQQQHHESSVLIKEEQDSSCDEQEWQQQKQAQLMSKQAALGSSGWQALLQQGKQYATGMSDGEHLSGPGFCATVKQELGSALQQLGPWPGRALLV